MLTDSQVSKRSANKDYIRQPSEVFWHRKRKILSEYLRGSTYEELAKRHRMTVSGIRTTLKWHIRPLMEAYHHWKMAEVKCEVLAWRLRKALYDRDYSEDPPLDSLDPPDCWKKALEQVGITTVGQLRTVSTELLSMSGWASNGRRVTQQCIMWAILTLDERGLSHRLHLRKIGAAAICKRLRPQPVDSHGIMKTTGGRYGRHDGHTGGDGAG